MSEVKDFFLAEEIQDSCESDDQAQFWQISVQQFALVWLIFFSYENKFPPCCQIQITLILLKVQGVLIIRQWTTTLKQCDLGNGERSYTVKAKRVINL